MCAGYLTAGGRGGGGETPDWVSGWGRGTCYVSACLGQLNGKVCMLGRGGWGRGSSMITTTACAGPSMAMLVWDKR